MGMLPGTTARRRPVDEAVRRLIPGKRRQRWHAFLAPPPYPGVRLTPKRLLNLYLNRYELGRLAVTLRSYPVKLTVEPTNVCNLRCPACFTGAKLTGRRRGPMPLALFRRLLDEMGDYLFQIEFTNWGEPLLARDVLVMFREASDRGISTITSTNFSLPFDEEAAERLVRSGLDVLGVSIDGATQETYEQYRVRGRLDLVLRNCRLVAEAKRRLRSAKPHLVWEFHVFPHNTGDVDLARSMAKDLDMELAVSRGWLVGEEWDRDLQWRAFVTVPEPFPCLFLWHYAVVNNDGGVAPCCGAFFDEDDMGRLATGPGEHGARTFREIWNGRRFQEARLLYRSRWAASPESRDSICHDCPTTVLWEDFQRHVETGGDGASFPRAPAGTSDAFNYFWRRRQVLQSRVRERAARAARPA